MIISFNFRLIKEVCFVWFFFYGGVEEIYGDRDGFDYFLENVGVVYFVFG